MAGSARNLSWRQGDLLSEEAFQAITELEDKFLSEETFAVVISHDCDLAANEDKEPNAEIIIAKQIRKLGADSFAKNARRLHLEYKSKVGPIVLELAATKKISLSKKILFNFTPSEELKLDKYGLIILQQWLASRYKRAAFPESFETRLRLPKIWGKKNLIEKIEEILETGGSFIRCLLFDLGDERDTEKVDVHDVYELGIVVLYESLKDEAAAHDAASSAAEELEKLFSIAFEKPSGEWINIRLKYCDPVSDSAITIAQSEELREWRLEHMSLKDYAPEARDEHDHK